MSSLQVISKEYQQTDGTAIVAHMVRMGDQDHMIVAEAAEACGVTPSYIRDAVSRHGLSACQAGEHDLAELKRLGVIPLKSPTVNLLPRATLDALMKIIDTPEAWAAYGQLWQVARAPKDAQSTAHEHLARGVSLAAKAASDAATMSLQVSARVEEVAASVQVVAAAISDRAQKDADDTLTAKQSEGLVDAMRKRAWRVSTSYKYISVQQLINYMKSCVKNYFFEPGIAGAMQWRDIRQSDLPQALAILETWDPAQNHHWARKHGAHYRTSRVGAAK